MELSRAMKVRRPLLWHFILTIEYINLTVHLLVSVYTAFMSNTELISLSAAQPCIYSGETYMEGETFPVGDRCNNKWYYP